MKRVLGNIDFLEEGEKIIIKIPNCISNSFFKKKEAFKNVRNLITIIIFWILLKVRLSPYSTFSNFIRSNLLEREKLLKSGDWKYCIM